MNLFELSQYTNIKALASVLLPDELSFHRSICRQYSIVFHTPLDQVLLMDPELVLLHLQENRLDAVDLENEEQMDKVIEAVYKAENPEYDREKDLEEQKWNEIMAKKRSTINKPTVKKDGSKKEEAKLPTKELPASGSLNLKYLSEMDETEG